MPGWGASCGRIGFLSRQALPRLALAWPALAAFRSTAGPSD